MGLSNRERQARWRARHPELSRKRSREWKRTTGWWERYRAENAERIKRCARKYRRSKRGRLRKRASDARRRANEIEAEGLAGADAVQARVDFYGGRCYLCGAPWEAIDHVIPLSDGGSNWPANLRPVCVRCNSSKGTRRLGELVSIGDGS